MRAEDVACLLGPELGFVSASAMGLHGFLHTLDVYGDSEPVIDYSPDEVDATKSVG
jgi:hypothetical protein